MPLLWRQISSGAYGRRNDFGLGDLELRIRTPMTKRKSREQLALHAGVKLPTAPLQEDAHGDPLPAALQPGTGAISPLAGASFLTTRGLWSVAASATLYLPMQVRTG